MDTIKWSQTSFKRKTKVLSVLDWLKNSYLCREKPLETIYSEMSHWLENLYMWDSSQDSKKEVLVSIFIDHIASVNFKKISFVSLPYLWKHIWQSSIIANFFPIECGEGYSDSAR